MLGILSLFVGNVQPVVSQCFYAGHFVFLCWHHSAYGECFMQGILSLFVGITQPMASALCWAFCPCLLAMFSLW